MINSNKADLTKIRGLYVQSSMEHPALFELPYIRGGMINMQWRDLDKGNGQYDFSRLDERLKLFHDHCLFSSIQINGNRRPSWLFEKIPYNPAIWETQTKDTQGTLMYWHPNYIKAYFDLLDALRGYLETSPYINNVLGIRLNFNAVGTEQLVIPVEHVPLTNWIVPEGVKSVEEWTPQIILDYKALVLETYVEKFSHILLIFIRNNVEEELRARYIKDFENGKFGWFHTSSEMEPRSKRESEYKYLTFMEYCRSGKAIGYTQAFANAWGVHGVKKDPRWCSPQQWAYWRLLSDLNMGISCIVINKKDLMIATRGYDLDNDSVNLELQKEFEAAMKFAARYVGQHVEPTKALGAFVAFRQREPENGILPHAELNEDYTFLALRLPDETKGVTRIGPDSQRFGAWARKVEEKQSIRIALHPELVESMMGTKTLLRVYYLNVGTTAWQVRWGAKTVDVTNTDSGRFEIVEVEVIPSSPVNDRETDSLFKVGMIKKANHDPRLAGDIIMTSTRGSNIFHMVEVIKK